MIQMTKEEAEALLRKLWLSRSTGHYGYPQYDTPERYNLKQAEEIFYNNIHFDDNIAVGDDYGQW